MRDEWTDTFYWKKNDLLKNFIFNQIFSDAMKSTTTLSALKNFHRVVAFVTASFVSPRASYMGKRESYHMRRCMHWCMMMFELSMDGLNNNANPNKQQQK